MLALQLGDVDQFPFLEAPDPRVVADGYRRLAEISAIDDARRLTPIGRTVAKLPIDVQLARMLVEAEKLHSLRDLLSIVSFLSIQDPRDAADARQQADAAHAAFADPKSDFVGVLNLWREYGKAHEDLTQSKLRDWCSRHSSPPHAQGGSDSCSSMPAKGVPVRPHIAESLNMCGRSDPPTGTRSRGRDDRRTPPTPRSSSAQIPRFSSCRPRLAASKFRSWGAPDVCEVL